METENNNSPVNNKEKGEDSPVDSRSKLTREFVTKNSRLVQSEEGLDLFCYSNCSNEDDENKQKCRGLVFLDDNLLVPSFGYTPEYTEDDDSELVYSHLSNGNFHVFDSHEGCLLRTFYYNNKCI